MADLNKTQTYAKANNKSHRFWITFIVFTLVLGGLAYATTISDSGTSTFTSNFSLSEDRVISLYANIIDQVPQKVLLNLYANGNQSRPFIAWYDNTDAVNPVSWMGCHNFTTGGDHHQHCEWEVVNSSGAMMGIFDIGYLLDPADMYARITNVKQFRLGSGVELFSRSGIIYAEGSNEGLRLSGGNQTTHYLKIKNDTDSVVIDSTDGVFDIQPDTKFNNEIDVLDDINAYNDVIIGNSTSGANKALRIRTDTSNDPEIWLMEGSGDSVGFKIKYQSSANDFQIYSRLSNVDTLRLSIDRDNGNLVIGNGTLQQNITMTSPDGTEYDCGVNNGGSFECT